MCILQKSVCEGLQLAGNLPVSGARVFMEHNSVMNVFGWVMSCY